jgi:hypothetical protein
LNVSFWNSQANAVSFVQIICLKLEKDAAGKLCASGSHKEWIQSFRAPGRLERRKERVEYLTPELGRGGKSVGFKLLAI